MCLSAWKYLLFSLEFFVHFMSRSNWNELFCNQDFLAHFSYFSEILQEYGQFGYHTKALLKSICLQKKKNVSLFGQKVSFHSNLV